MTQLNYPRSSKTELRVIFKDNLYYLYMVTIYDDDKEEKEVTPFLIPVCLPRHSLKELKKYLKEQMEACKKPIINVNSCTNDISGR